MGGASAEKVKAGKGAPELTRNRFFEFELLVSEWKVWRGCFHNARDVNVRVRRRRMGSERPRLVTEEMR